MVRTPKKTCPGLYNLFEQAQMGHLFGFLRQKDFERQAYLEPAREMSNEAAIREFAMGLLSEQRKEVLRPLEQEAARIVTVAERRGEFALEGLAKTKLSPDQHLIFLQQKGELARSFWTYLEHRLIFEAVEGVLHKKNYRNYGRHYQTFHLGSEHSSEDGKRGVLAFMDALEKCIDRGPGCIVHDFDYPSGEGEVERKMYLIYHPRPFATAQDMDEYGEKSTFYIRPPSEAMVIYTPSTSTIEVRAESWPIRQKVAKTFAERISGRILSSEPVDARDYDMSRFFKGFQLDCPEMDDAAIRRVAVIRAEVSMLSLLDRLSLICPIESNLDELIDKRKGLRSAFSLAVAIRFVEIAIRYVPRGETEERTVDFTISDSNSCSLQSLPDERDRVIGHRLLRHWGILHEFRPLTKIEEIDAIPYLLDLWNEGMEIVTGSWLEQRRIDTELLLDTGFLFSNGWEEEELVEADDAGLVPAGVIAIGDRAKLQVTHGQEFSGGASGWYRRYNVRAGWLVQKLREALVPLIDEPNSVALSKNLYSMGRMDLGDGPVPVYLARRLDDEKALIESERIVLKGSGGKAGIVLAAGTSWLKCLGGSVLVTLSDHLEADANKLSLNANSLKKAYRLNKMPTSNEVDLKSTETKGQLTVSGQPPKIISGIERLKVMKRMVDLHKTGRTIFSREDVAFDRHGQQFGQIFGTRLWAELKQGYVRSAGYDAWQFDVD